MINFKDITKAVETLLRDYNTDNEPYTIVRSSAVNTDINIAASGWIGIYRGNVNYQPHSAGRTWLAEIDIRIEVQAASMHSAKGCEEKLDELVTFVLNASSNEPTIGGTVHSIREYDVDYDDAYAEDINTSQQFATITITAEVKA